MKHLLLASLITLLAFGTACGQAPEPEPAASDGIQVHGHWTVTVTNPDGTVDAVHEFENTLAQYGSGVLTALLAGETTVQGSLWELRLKQPYSSSGGIDSALTCQESASTGSYHTEIPAVATRNNLVNGSPLTLAGVCTVQTTETTVMISEVWSMIRMNPGITATGGTTSLVGTPFVKHTLDESITAANNQSLSFNVVISFS